MAANQVFSFTLCLAPHTLNDTVAASVHSVQTPRGQNERDLQDTHLYYQRTRNLGGIANDLENSRTPKPELDAVIQRIHQARPFLPRHLTPVLFARLSPTTERPPGTLS